MQLEQSCFHSKGLEPIGMLQGRETRMDSYECTLHQVVYYGLIPDFCSEVLLKNLGQSAQKHFSGQPIAVLCTPNQLWIELL